MQLADAAVRRPFLQAERRLGKARLGGLAHEEQIRLGKIKSVHGGVSRDSAQVAAVAIVKLGPHGIGQTTCLPRNSGNGRGSRHCAWLPA